MKDFLKLGLCCYYVLLLQGVYGSSVPILSSGSYCNSSSSNDGQSVQYAVPGTTISITCAVDNPDGFNSILKWTILQFGVSVTNSDDGADRADADQPDFVSTVNSVDNTDDTINATLTFTAVVELDGLQVECTGTQNSVTSSCTLLILTPPTVPVSPSCSDITYNSITVVWYPPVDNGGEPVSHYTITQSSPGDTSTTTTTTTTSTITDLLPLTHYTFTISANNSQGYGNDSAVVNCTTATGLVFPPVLMDDIEICLGYYDRTVFVDITLQDCPPSSPNATTIPPFHNYTITINEMEPVTMKFCTLERSISEERHYLINITVAINNAVGRSQAVPTTFDSRWIKNIIAMLSNVRNVFSYSIVDCHTLDEAKIMLIVTNESTTGVRYERMEDQPYDHNYTSFDVSKLSPTGSYNYTLLLVISSDTIITSYAGKFIAMTTKKGPPDPTGDPTRSTPTPTVERQSDLNLPVIAGGVAGGVITVLVVIIIILLVVYCVCLKSKSDSVEFLGTKRGDDPIPLKDTSIKPPAHAQPETGQGFYQDPNTIEHKLAPTGDMYSVPDKGSKRRAPPQQPELATYQDPSTIQRQEAPTGDIYTQPQQKPVYSKVNKDNKQQGSEYAELDLEGEVGGLKSPTQQPLIHNQDHQQQAVLYSDLKSF